MIYNLIMTYQHQKILNQPELHAKPFMRWENTDTLEGLVHIFEPSVHLIRLRRAVPQGVHDYLNALDRIGLRLDRIRYVLSPGAALPNEALPDLPGRDSMQLEIQSWSELLADLTGCPKVGVRIEMPDQAMCPRMHVDHVTLRLITTWRGPGTEWLDEAGADRSRLGSEEVILSPSAIHRATTGDVLLLKGERWPGNDGRGVLHRSPQSDDNRQTRILFACDAVW